VLNGKILIELNLRGIDILSTGNNTYFRAFDCNIVLFPYFIFNCPPKPLHHILYALFRSVFLSKPHSQVIYYSLDDAIANWNKAIELNPDDPEAYYTRGRLKADKGSDLDGAIADWKKALEIDSGMWPAWANLATVYSEKRDKEECLNALRNLFRLNPQQKKWAAGQSEFDWLRDDPEFKALIEK
jgi:tetratricopeptide (TPR) repeat protein